VKLLLDENLSRRILPFLEKDFPGSTQVALIGLEQASDEEIWCHARDHDFCIVTKDADFYDLSLVRGPPPKIIWLKSGNVTKAAIAQLLLSNKYSIKTLLAADETTCVEITDRTVLSR
jgi:predicted nuclease of predicted toxin-antitoxin system